MVGNFKLIAAYQDGKEQVASLGVEDPFDQESFHLKFPKRKASDSFDFLQGQKLGL